LKNPSLNQIVVVLYQPQDVVNVGSIVRVLSNFGLLRLRLVEPAAWDAYRVGGIAHHTEPIIAAVQRFATLEEALADCNFVLGTTARPRGTRRERLTPRVAASTLLAAQAKSPENICAILFGREDDGLPNEALDYCHALVTIPTDDFNPSLNLAQAVLVICYELWLAANPRIEEEQPLPNIATNPSPGAPPKYGDLPSVVSALEEALEEDARLANGTEREQLFETLTELLRTLYPSTSDARMVYAMARLRAIFLRSAPRKDETPLLTHLFKHIIRSLKPRI
jgi:tRNA/rRNA methyltransferase/tRNA (cytidine32/uridine32-2'-O)-methyltransferase